MRVLPFTALLPLAIAVPALAQNSQPAADSEAADSEIICKYQAKTGTRFAKKTCRTKAQWEALYQKSRRDAEENLNKPTISIDRGN